ncbi:MAG: hypothetical protein K2P78_08875 [Gemmataceae bacterium]|nr:hypothetical protein [Gemmataceae bacterium]
MRKEPLNIETDRPTLRKLLDTARAFDLERDGLYDARFGLINVWCSPDDKPACWTAEITRGCLTHPRAYVGDLDWDWLDDDRVVLHVEADPYDLLDRRPRRPDLTHFCGRGIFRDIVFARVPTRGVKPIPPHRPTEPPKTLAHVTQRLSRRLVRSITTPSERS